MKKFLALLVLANILFFIYRYVAPTVTADAMLSHQQLNREKIKVLPLEKADTTTAKLPVSLAALPVCLEWGSFGGIEQTRVEQALTALQLGESLSQRKIESTVGYWVYIPASVSKAEAEKKIRQLQALGIADHFLVQDSSEFRNAISLGIFKSEETANRYLEQLRQKGVRSAKAGPRDNQLRLVNYIFRDPGEKLSATLAELQQKFPGSELRTAQCEATKPVDKPEAKI